MRRLAALLLPVALVFGVAACDVYPPENSLGHCAQAQAWRSGDFFPLEYVSTLTWSTRFRNGDPVYECSGVDWLGLNWPAGVRLCWETAYSDPPHRPKDIHVCGTPV